MALLIENPKRRGGGRRRRSARRSPKTSSRRRRSNPFATSRKARKRGRGRRRHNPFSTSGIAGKLIPAATFGAGLWGASVLTTTLRYRFGALLRAPMYLVSGGIGAALLLLSTKLPAGIRRFVAPLGAGALAQGVLQLTDGDAPLAALNPWSLALKFNPGGVGVNGLGENRDLLGIGADGDAMLFGLGDDNATSTWNGAMTYRGRA